MKIRTIAQTVLGGEPNRVESADVTPKELLAHANKEFEKYFTRMGPLHLRQNWYDAADRVLDWCDREKQNPFHYITSQIESLGPWCKRTKKMFYPNFLTGEKACNRFLEWQARNKRMTGTVHRRERNKNEDNLVVMESRFLELYILADLSRGESIEVMRVEYPTWRFVPPKLKMRVLYDFLLSLNILAPDIIYVRNRKWSWKDVKKMYGELFVIYGKRKLMDIDDDEGVMI